VTAVSLEPTQAYLRLDGASSLREWRERDRFAVVRVETTEALGDAVRKSSHVPAVLMSMSLRPLAAADYRLCVDGKVVPTGRIHPFRANVIELAAEPSIWAGGGADYVHFHVRRTSIDETAADLGYGPLGSLRLTVAEEDIVLAQIARTVLPSLGPDNVGPHPLALDHLELILCAHLLQRYGGLRLRTVVSGGLAVWQQRRALEFMHENLDARVRLADLARECELSVTHFARAFKTTFGITTHQWLTNRRIDRAKELLADTSTALAEIAMQSGFGDQAAFTRTFHRLVGMTPGTWRREQARREK
jgi:AraC family transcriptional regulator